MESINQIVNSLISQGPVGIAVLLMVACFALIGAILFFGAKIYLASLQKHYEEKQELMQMHQEKQEVQNSKLGELLEKSTEAQCANANAINSVCKMIERIDGKLK